MSICIVWDTEYTTWDGARERGWCGPGEHRELVQLAAQKVDLSTGAVKDKIEFFVRPLKNPRLSDFFIKLTTITQDVVDREGISFPEAYRCFKDFSGGLPCLSYSFGDLTMMQECCDLHGMAFDLKNAFIDARVYFKNAGIDVSKHTSGTICKSMGLTLDGHVHFAMDDVRSLTGALLTLYARKKFLIS